jgi:diacylglycerol kinase family enzyme
MNTVATSLGVPRTSPEQAVRRLVEAERGTRELAERRLSTLDAAGRLGFLFGTGVARTFLEEYYRRGNSHPTPTDAVRTLARMSAGVVVRGPRARRLLAPEQFALELDEVRWPSRPYTLILAATIQDVGLGFRPFYRVTQGDGRLQLLGLHGSPSRILVRLPRAFRGRPLGADCAVDALVERATLHASTADVVRFFVDGDLHESRSPLDLTTGPEVRLAWAR